MIDFTDIPIVDLHQFLAGSSQESAAARLRTICKSSGFFYVVNHGVAAELQLQMEQEAEKFFQLSQTEKQEIHMKKGGRAWRGYFFMGE